MIKIAGSLTVHTIETNESNRDINAIFIDVRSAFDTVARPQMITDLHRADIPTDLIEMCTKNTKAKVRLRKSYI